LKKFLGGIYGTNQRFERKNLHRRYIMAQIKDLSVKTSIGGIYGIESLGTI
jgi:hypothetical protein